MFYLLKIYAWVIKKKTKGIIPGVGGPSVFVLISLVELRDCLSLLMGQLDRQSRQNWMLGRRADRELP